MEQAPSQVMAQLRPTVLRSTAVEASGWSDVSGASPPPSGERGRESVVQHGAFRLLNDGGLHQCLEVPVDRLFLWVDGLGKATQKHRRRGDVLASLSELWGIVLPIDDVALNLVGATLGTARWVTRMGCIVVC